MPLDADPSELAGRAVRDRNGRLLGDLDVVFGDRVTGRPRFGGITTARGYVVVPVDEARFHRDDSTVELPFTEALLDGAPAVDPQSPGLDPETERAITEHFAGQSETAVVPRVAQEDAAEMVLSEEQLLVETNRVPAERVRLRKRVVEEDVTLTVTLRREELVVEREPVGTDEALVESRNVPDEPLEFVLWAEEPVVTTRAVPSERVRVRREVVTEDRELRETLKRERAEVVHPNGETETP